MDELIPAALAGERIDRVVSMLASRSRADVAAAIDEGRIRVDGRVARTKSLRVHEGQRVQAELAPIPAAVELVGDPAVGFEVVHEDGDVVVVDKPAGLVVHPGAGHESGTLVHGLLARYPEIADVGAADRPGIVHRLDRGTSGLLAVARSSPAYDGLVAQLAARSVDRRYAAIVIGAVDEPAGVVDAPVGRSDADPTKMAVSVNGREARTRYEVTGRFTDPVDLTELDCRLETGRTHQIRVHLAAIGHPVAGDARYGGDRPALTLGRPYLHARFLRFVHPVTGKDIECSSPLPRELVSFRDGLS